MILAILLVSKEKLLVRFNYHDIETIADVNIQQVRPSAGYEGTTQQNKNRDTGEKSGESRSVLISGHGLLN
jgi:hypothetical protein